MHLAYPTFGAVSLFYLDIGSVIITVDSSSGEATRFMKEISHRIAEADVLTQVARLNTDGRLMTRLVRYFSHLKFNTAKTYLHWIRVWGDWYYANAAHETSWPASAIPAHPEAFEAFVEHLGGRLRRSSVVSCVQALNSIHKKGLDAPGVLSSEIWFILETLKNDETRRQTVTRQATPFMLPDLKKLIALYAGTHSVRKLRDLCLIWLGFETLLRSVEIRRIRFQDLRLDDMSLEFTLSVYRTKTTASTNLSYRLSPQLSTSLLRLMNLVGKDGRTHPTEFLFQAVNAHDTGYMPEGWLLRSRGNDIDTLLQRHNMPYRASRTVVQEEEEEKADDEGILSKDTLLRAFYDLWLTLNPDEDEIRCWTGHSVRVGGAIQLAQNGYSLVQIMEMGNWSSQEMVLRYIRNIEAGNKAMTLFMREAFREA